MKKEEHNDMEFTKSELEFYDKHVNTYYINLINSLILYTYTEKQLDEMTPILIAPLIELYEELDYAFTPILFKTILKNKLIDHQLKDKLLNFKSKVDEIPNEIWDWKYLDNHQTWIKIRAEAEELLNKLNITTRQYNTENITIISSNGDVLFEGKKTI